MAGAPVAHEQVRVVRVLPDIVGLDKEFDYIVPAGTGGDLVVGDRVRIDLHGRRVGGWLLAVDVEPADRARLKPLAKVTGRGPSAELVDLAAWAAWRWAGRRAQLLRTASPPGVVRSVVPAGSASATASGGGQPAADSLIASALAARRGVLRLPPGDDRFPLVLAAATSRSPDGDGDTLILCPSVGEAQRLGSRLRASGVEATALTGDRTGAAGAGEWARAAAGGTVVGTRAGAWAPVNRLGRVVVLDEHDEVYQEERSPTWHARDVVIERARRAGAPCLLVSPCPTLEALRWGELITVDPAAARRGWPHLTVVDQRQRDPAIGPLFSPELVDLLRSSDRVVCVLNRIGRSRLLACVACETLARCERCDAAVALPEPGVLRCPRCGTERPVVCLACGATKLKNLRPGVSRVREELSALIGEPVGEIAAGTGGAQSDGNADARIIIGTEAALHRLPRADAVAFLDFDQELLAPRYRGAEQALGLLARAARLVRSRPGTRHGRLLVQTRTPDHPVLQAVRHADPGRLVLSERPMREALGLPPTTAMAVVSGQAASDFIAAFGHPPDLLVQGPVDGHWRLTAPDHVVLCDALAAAARPPGRLRIEVDPLRI